MTAADIAADRPAAARHAHGPASLLAAAAAPAAMDVALRGAGHEAPEAPEAVEAAGAGPGPGSEQASASLMLLRQVREQLTGGETGPIETAPDAGASRPDLARPLRVASRQAAERRHLRGRPGAAATTEEQHVTATRQARAADRPTASRAHTNAGRPRHRHPARTNAADLCRLAGQITALGNLAPEASSARPLSRAALHAALGDTSVSPRCRRDRGALRAPGRHAPLPPTASSNPWTPSTTGVRRQPQTMTDSHAEPHHAGAVRPAGNHADDGQRSVPAPVRTRL
ncbi:hypothetical protein OV450_2558 [Actinobacteria bacterium OV450]|nr:hypothetical protein OV450_2558 [Actinobacteria bacterium OV450]